MDFLKALVFFLVFSALSAFGIWNYWMFSNYDIPSPWIYLQTIEYGLSSPQIAAYSKKSLFLGTFLGTFATYLYMKALRIKFKTKGFIRGAEFFFFRKIKKNYQIF